MIWWTKSWNPITGCTKCSPACANCYAERLHTQRHAALLAGKNVPECYTTPFDRVRFHPRLDAPLHWKKPQRIFVCNMGDLFHEDVLDLQLDSIFAIMAMCPQHTFMLLTKRYARMQQYVTHLPHRMRAWTHPGWPMPLPNVWLGVTIWDQASADRAVPLLLSTPAAKRFVSVEPMLGPVDLRAAYPEDFHYCTSCGWYGEETEHSCTMCDSGTPYMPDTHGRCQNGHDGYRTDCCPKCGNDGRVFVFDSVHEDQGLKLAGLDWVICGGETGPGARPMHPDWPRKLRDDCVAAGVPFFFKQWGEWAPDCPVETQKTTESRIVPMGNGGGRKMWRIGTRRAGRELDGRTWEEVPAC